MSPANVLEPTFDAIRRQLFSGELRPGHRLEAARLAADFGVSITPVRDCLNRLAGERLVYFSPGEGFQVPKLNEIELRALLGWQHLLLMMALNDAEKHGQKFIIAGGHDGSASRAAMLFAAVGSVADNIEVRAAISQNSARLHGYRHREDLIFNDISDEIGQLEQAIKNSQFKVISDLLEAYHQRRIQSADRLVHIS